MRLVTSSIVCERVRAQISLRLDGELSELETRMLEAHVTRCEQCASYEADVVSMTSCLRQAPLEQLEHPIVLRKPRRRVSLARMQVGVAAAFAVAMLGVAAQIGQGPHEPSLTSPTKFATNEQLSREVKQIIANGRSFQKSSGSTLPI
jgi:anti-sigma factor RsiW